MPGTIDDYIKEKQDETAAEVAAAEVAAAEGAGEAGAGEAGAGEAGAGEAGAGEAGAGEAGAGEAGAGEAGAGEAGAPVGINDEQLNTFFDTEGKTQEDIKAVYGLGAKASELESENSEISQELETLKDQHAKLKEELNPLSYFSSEEAYVAEQLRKKYPTMDAVAIQKAIMTDVSKMDDLDVLALQDVIKRPGVAGGEALAKRLIADDLGIDLETPPEEWGELAKGKLTRAAYDARQELGKFQQEVELPTTKSEEDLLAESAQKADAIKKEWEPILPELTKFDKISIPGPEGSQPFEFEVPQSFKDGLGEMFEAMITSGELEANKDTVAFMMEQRNKEFIYQNLGKIREAIEADVRSSVTKKTDEELNNQGEPNSNARPAGEVEVGGTEKFLEGQKGVRYN